MFIVELGFIEFYAAVTAIALGFGRLLKSLAPKLPARLLPWLVVLVAGGLVVADQLLGGADMRHALYYAAFGLLSGFVAVGSHELAKGALVPVVAKVVGAERAEAIVEALLGKLKDKVQP